MALIKTYMGENDFARFSEAVAVGETADLVFKWQNGVLIAPVNPRLSQVVRSTPLGVPCSELQ
jgi:hypothetical protein